LAVWLWYYGQQGPSKLYESLPYTTRGVVAIEGKYPQLRIETIDDIWNEVDKLCQENTKFSDGQNLYHTVPLFADPNKLTESWMWDMIQEYNYVNRFGVSLGELDNVSAFRLDCFSIIDREINNCMKFEQKKNG